MVSVVSFSEAGGHAVNEDAFAVQAHPDDAACWLCTLADGQGGQAGGGPAARRACATAMNGALRLTPRGLRTPSAWTSLLGAADRAVAADPTAGFTTLVGLSVAGERLFGASSGDSAVLLVNGNGETPRLTDRQVKNPPVGSGGAPFVPFAGALVPPWKILLMSDGVWKYVGWERLVAAAQGKRGQELIEGLQAQARLPGSGQFQDDFTLVLLESAVET